MLTRLKYYVAKNNTPPQMQTSKGDKFKGGEICPACDHTVEDYRKWYITTRKSKYGVGNAWKHHCKIGGCDGSWPPKPLDAWSTNRWKFEPKTTTPNPEGDDSDSGDDSSSRSDDERKEAKEKEAKEKKKLAEPKPRPAPKRKRQVEEKNVEDFQWPTTKEIKREFDYVARELYALSDKLDDQCDKLGDAREQLTEITHLIKLIKR